MRAVFLAGIAALSIVAVHSAASAQDPLDVSLHRTAYHELPRELRYEIRDHSGELLWRCVDRAREPAAQDPCTTGRTARHAGQVTLTVAHAAPRGATRTTSYEIEIDDTTRALAIFLRFDEHVGAHDVYLGGIRVDREHEGAHPEITVDDAWRLHNDTSSRVIPGDNRLEYDPALEIRHHGRWTRLALWGGGCGMCVSTIEVLEPGESIDLQSTRCPAGALTLAPGQAVEGRVARMRTRVAILRTIGDRGTRLRAPIATLTDVFDASDELALSPLEPFARDERMVSRWR